MADWGLGWKTQTSAEAITPESTGTDVKACFLCGICRSAELLSTERPQRWFERHIFADLLQHTGGEIPKLVVSHHGVATAHTVQGVVHRERLPTGAVRWQVVLLSIVSHAQDITERGFGQRKPVTGHRQDSEPVEGTLV